MKREYLSNDTAHMNYLGIYMKGTCEILAEVDKSKYRCPWVRVIEDTVYIL